MTPGPGAAIRTMPTARRRAELFGRHRAPRRARPASRSPEPGHRPAGAVTARRRHPHRRRPVAARSQDRSPGRDAARGSRRRRSSTRRRSPRPRPRPDNSIDQALAEIEARQRMLDGGPATPRRSDLPRAPTQSLPDLEQQLRQINTRLDNMRPCGIDAAVETLRDDLAEIGMMLKEAMPRQAIEALESEIRALAARIDDERHAGADGVAMARRRARPRRSPRRAARPDPRRKPGRLRRDAAAACRRRSTASPAPARIRRR